MNWRDRTRRPRNLLCRWFGHKWWTMNMVDSPYWERTCLRCDRDETNEPLSIRNRRLHAEEYAKVQDLLGEEMAGYFESAMDSAIEDVRRVK